MAQTGSAAGNGEEAPAPEKLIDWAFFVFGGISAVWFAVLLLEESLSWRYIWFLLIFWAVLAYLVLPRLHRILTRIYIPNYFMGRSRTSDGLFGDPVNLALLGPESRLREALDKAGWTEADPVDLRSSWHIITSTVLRRSYDNAPVSPLFLFGRQQDFAYQQEVDGTPGQRHHVRFWKCPDGWKLPGGIAVEWLAAASYDRSVGVSYFTLQVTHRIGADVDQERDHVVASLSAVSPAVTVTVIKDFSSGYHSRNGGGDSIETDGDLPIVDLAALPLQPGDSTPVRVESRELPPAPTVVGAALVFLRVIAALSMAGLLFSGSAERTWVADLVGEDGQVLDDAGTYVPLAVVILVFACFETGLALLILRGSNWARLTAMALSSGSIILQGASFLAGDPSHTLQGERPAYALDVLILLALSSERARLYAHRRRARKRARLRIGCG
ncbi:LssY C-terminal domain-containing protein [Arthrobacter sp.]|uniref:LssY C-terminal domain-containing protein n=1 Tax=Arthrobacter sp. TaxID=1667 RepID=UPI0028A2774E|nr:LssY C-terminal domain-containing protein [Arthrobacter sp.]